MESIMRPKRTGLSKQRLARALPMMAAFVVIAALVSALYANGGAHAFAGDAVPEPEGYRTDNYRSAVPRTLAGAVSVPMPDAAKSLRDAGAVFIDVYPRAPKPPNLPAATVWREPSHRSIPGAYWLPNVGYGNISEEMAGYFSRSLERLSAGRKDMPMVFFCLSDCWMSWNAAKRAMAMGYTAVHWFPDGTDGWELIGEPLTNLTPVP